MYDFLDFDEFLVCCLWSLQGRSLARGPPGLIEIRSPMVKCDPTRPWAVGMARVIES